MALDEEDRTVIQQMIDAATKRNAPPPPPKGEPALKQGDWDGMGEMERRAFVRSTVEERLAELDAEAEREDLKARVKELEAENAAMKKGNKPKDRSGGVPAGERAPAILNKVQEFLWGRDPAKPSS